MHVFIILITLRSNNGGIPTIPGLSDVKKTGVFTGGGINGTIITTYAMTRFTTFDPLRNRSTDFDCFEASLHMLQVDEATRKENRKSEFQKILL